MSPLFFYWFLLSRKVEANNSLYITHPTKYSKWNINTFVNIRWVNTNPSAETINIDLLHGDPSNADYVLNIISNLPGASTSYVWTVNLHLQNSNDYFLKMTAFNKNGKNVDNYSDKFKITVLHANNTSNPDDTSHKTTNDTNKIVVSNASHITMTVGYTSLYLCLTHLLV